MSSRHRSQRRRGVRPRTSSPLPGLPPGTLVAPPGSAAPVLNLLAYGEPAGGDDKVAEGWVERRLEHPEQALEVLGRRRVTWLNVDGLADVATIEAVGKTFGLHRLALEDVLTPGQRSKLETYGDHLFLVVRMAWPGPGITTEQVSIFLGRDFVVTFQERHGDCLEPVRERLRRGRGRLRADGPDYLVFAVLDAIVDHYFPVLEEIGERLEALEDEALARPDTATTVRIQEVRRDLLVLRRAIWPAREVLSALTREPLPQVGEETRLYLRTCHDHAIHVIDLLETHREIASGLMDVFLSAMSQRMNEVMKVLTIIATIFIPLSFIAGIYGMNFDPEVSPWNMPELAWTFGYPFALGLMAAVASGLLLYFRRRGWLGRRSRRPRPASEPPTG